MGVLDGILAALAREADLDWLMIDSTIVRAHQQAAGASRQKMGFGRSRGGSSTKTLAAGDALGNPVRLVSSLGQPNDIAFAHELVEGFAADLTITDKGYNSDHLCEKIGRTGGEVIILPKRNRIVKRPYDPDLYKERNIIECFINKLNQFRRVATRYDKLLVNFMGFVKLAAIAIWLK